ncbi:MAG: hypothetical protein JJU41_10140 [Bacteroidetes bacterium]|nr:hypothetical protein [Bacteroidota bacterium]
MISHRLTILIILLVTSLNVKSQTLEAGDNAVSVDFRISPVLTNAQSLSLATLGINTSGQGIELFEIIIQNVSGRELSSLYLRIEVSSSRFGRIAEIYSRTGSPFSMLPAQVIIATNNNLDRGLSGIPSGSLNARLTSDGERFLSSFDGSPTIPDDIYTFTVSVLADDAQQGVGRLLATATDIIGATPIQNTVDFELLQPGGPFGTGDIITTLNPSFRWEGPINQTYRLIIVEDAGQSPNSLIQSARSTDPVSGPGATGSRLLEFEMVDVLVRGNSWQFPVGGVRSLEHGKRYFWQIFARIDTATGFEERPSSIFEFSIPASGEPVTQIVQSRDVAPLVTGISINIGSQLLNLIEQGYEITSIELNGIRYSGQAMIAVLEDFANGVQTGEIKLVAP